MNYCNFVGRVNSAERGKMLYAVSNESLINAKRLFEIHEDTSENPFHWKSCLALF